MPPAERKRELTIGPKGPWAARVYVDAVAKEGGRQTSLPQDWLFEVIVEWTGPPMLGMPESDEPVQSRDVYVLSALENARALARKAADAFAAGGDHPPDLRELATGRTALEQARTPRFWTPSNGAK